MTEVASFIGNIRRGAAWTSGAASRCGVFPATVSVFDSWTFDAVQQPVAIARLVAVGVFDRWTAVAVQEPSAVVLLTSVSRFHRRTVVPVPQTDPEVLQPYLRSTAGPSSRCSLWLT